MLAQAAANRRVALLVPRGPRRGTHSHRERTQTPPPAECKELAFPNGGKTVQKVPIAMRVAVASQGPALALMTRRRTGDAGRSYYPNGLR